MTQKVGLLQTDLYYVFKGTTSKTNETILTEVSYFCVINWIEIKTCWKQNMFLS